MTGPDSTGHGPAPGAAPGTAHGTARGAAAGRVLIAAGSDSGGGAGIQADIKTVTALGGFAMTAITALTAQTTRGVFGVQPVPPDFVADQARLVLEDLGADAIKTGMLGSAPVIDALCDVIERHARTVPLVVDPVMVAKGGDRLLDVDAATTLPPVFWFTWLDFYPDTQLYAA